MTSSKPISPIKVTRKEYAKEISELTRLRTELRKAREEYDRKWDILRRTVERIRYYERRVSELEARLEALRRIGWARLGARERREYTRIRDELIPEARSRLANLASEREKIISEIRSMMPEIRRLEEAIRAEEARLPRKIIVAPVKAVVDSMTGYLIAYLNTDYKGYRCWLYDEKEDEFIEPVTAIRIEKTISLETEGHQDLTAEITAYTIIPCEELPRIEFAAATLEDKAKRWFAEEKFANVTKYGIVVAPNFKKWTEDFSIQRREKGAKYEMSIAQWYATVTGEWAERPRILKEGFGAYVTRERPIYPTIRVYTEYSHEDEPFPAHREPPKGAEEY